MKNITRLFAIMITAAYVALPSIAFAEGAFLEITLKIDEQDRSAAGGVYVKYKQPFLTQIKGATSKDLLVRKEDVQVLHGFESVDQAEAYLSSNLFAKDVVGELGPLLKADPEVRIYSIF